MENRRPVQKGKQTWGLKPKDAKKKARKAVPVSLLPRIQSLLAVLLPNSEEQAAWMETLHPLFAVTPAEMIRSGREARVLMHLEEWQREG